MTTELADAVLTALRRRRLVFLQATPLVEQSLETLSARESVQVARLAELDVSDRRESSLVVVKQFDELLCDPDPTSSLGRARATANELLDAGHSICLLSRAPRMAFPRCPGSSLLDDAYVIHPDSALEGQPHWDEELDPDELRAGLINLGPDVLACLDYLYFDLQFSRSASTSLITPLELEAIRGAGLVALNAAGDQIEPTVSHARLIPALTDAIVGHLNVQPDFPAVAGGLVEIERRLRRVLQARAVACFGTKWRGSVLHEDLKTKVEERATQELSRAVTVKGLRSPFEWLTMGELVDLIRNATWADRLGREDRYWQRFAVEVMPIRNRLSHMRFLRQQDRARVEHWRVALSKTFS